MSTYSNITVHKEPNASVKIEGEIPYEALAKHKDAALRDLQKNVKIDGFRPGHIPEDVLTKHVGEMTLLHEMAERALGEAFPKIIVEHEIDAIGQPQISITKLAVDNPLGFQATIATMPEVTLPDYMKTAAEHTKEPVEITDAMVDEAIETLQKQKQSYERIQKQAEAKQKAESEGQTLPTPETVEQSEDEKEEPLPELTDEYVKTLGEFENVADFKAKLKEHLSQEKENEAKSKHRSAVTDAIIDATDVEVPQVMIDAEINQMFAQMEEDLKRANLKLDDYLSHMEKSREDLQKEWQEPATKRAKLQLVLNEIAKKEKVTPDAQLVSAQVEQLKQQYPDADEVRVRVYVESILQNEAVMQKLTGEEAAPAA